MTELSEKSAAEKRRGGGGGGGDVGGSRTDGVSVLPWSGDADAHLLSLMVDVTRRVSALQTAVTDMRQENKLNYRQLKRQLIKLSSDSRLTRPAAGHDDDSAARQLHAVHSGTRQPLYSVVPDNLSGPSDLQRT